ncbi:hypothetical protein [Saccharopolyspora elongata]|uniref:hypothetical protein n=1 Tax=Saccharopolyspora elongata TaxID=2530387 RepID=UPI0014049C09|nr:hypothetical protein [Saccharopolyspora elongata]
MIISDVAALGVVFAGKPPVDEGAVFVLGGFAKAVGGEQFAVHHDVGRPLPGGVFERFVQVRGLIGEDVDDLVDIAVTSGAANVVVPGQFRDRGAVEEPPQPQNRLCERGQRPSPARGEAPPAFGGQQPREVAGEFVVDIERGSIGSHVGSLVMKMIL